MGVGQRKGHGYRKKDRYKRRDGIKRGEKDMNRERMTLIGREKDRDRGREEQFIERQE